MNATNRMKTAGVRAVRLCCSSNGRRLQRFEPTFIFVRLVGRSVGRTYGRRNGRISQRNAIRSGIGQFRFVHRRRLWLLCDFSCVRCFFCGHSFCPYCVLLSTFSNRFGFERGKARCKWQPVCRSALCQVERQRRMNWDLRASEFDDLRCSARTHRWFVDVLIFPLASFSSSLSNGTAIFRQTDVCQSSSMWDGSMKQCHNYNSNQLQTDANPSNQSVAQFRIDLLIIFSFSFLFPTTRSAWSYRNYDTESWPV